MDAGVSSEPLAPPAGLRRRFWSSSAWAACGYGASQVLRLGSNLIVSRLLVPDAFGLMALVNVFMQGLEMFSDLGLRPAIIRSSRGDDPAFLRTAWTVQILRGVLLWVLACALAWPATLVYPDKALIGQLLPVAGLTAVIGGFASTALITRNRRLDLARLTTLELVAQVVGLVAMVLLAWWFRSVWALLAAGLVTSSVKVALSHLVLGGVRHRLHWDREAWHELYGFGRWVFLSTAITFLSTGSDRLILGTVLSTRMLGIYSLAFMIAEAGRQLFTHLGHRVLLPTFSERLRDDPGGLAAACEETRRRVDAPALLGAGLVLTLGSLFITSLWDSRWHAAGAMLQALGLRVAIGYTLPYAWACQAAQGTLRPWVRGNVLRATWLWLMIPVAHHLGGLDGAVWAVALSDLPLLAVSMAWMAKQRLLSWRREALGLGWLALGAMVGLGIERLITGGQV